MLSRDEALFATWVSVARRTTPSCGGGTDGIPGIGEVARLRRFSDLRFRRPELDGWNWRFS